MTADAGGSVWPVRSLLALAVALTAAGQLRALPPSASAPAPPPPASRPSTRPASTRPAPTAPAPSAVRVRTSVIRFLEERVQKDPDDIVTLNRLAGEYLRRFRASGDDADIALSVKAAEQSLASVPADFNKGALAARARASFSLHRFAEARADAEKLLSLEPNKRYPLETLGDALLELGEYDKAAEAYAKLEQSDEPDPTTEARLARLALLKGDTEGAKRRLAAAVALAGALSPPMPEVLAWAHVRAGELAFSTGDWPAAEKHYLAALEADPGDWPALDHLAELRAAQKRFGEAVASYRTLVARVPRPELLQALGDVYAAAGNANEAKAWHDAALVKYLKAAGEGSSHYYHHLAGFYCDSQPNPPEALKWARKDLEVRHGVHAYEALAWALYQNGEFAPAADAMDRALSLGTKDPHMLYHASLVYYRAGKVERGRECLKQAAQANPKFMEFHVHR
jgi:tetratricopeptide (TPR) repeat protein